MKKVFFYLLAFLINGCNSIKNNQINITILDSLIVNENHKINFNGKNPLTILEKGNLIYCNFFPLNHIIYIYNKQERNIKDSIVLSNYYFNEFYVENLDSIWIFGDNLKNKKRGLLSLIDSEGNIKKEIDILKKVEHIGYPISKIFYVKNNKFSGKVIFAISPNSIYGTAQQEKKYRYSNEPIICYYDVYKDTLIFNNDIKYPYISNQDNIFYPKGFIDYYYIHVSLIDPNLISICFAYTPWFYIWNISNNTTTLIKSFKSHFYDSIVPCNEPCDKIDEGIYYSINKLNDSLYIRYITLPEKYNRKVMYILSDKKFNYIGEYFFDFNTPHVFNKTTPFSLNVEKFKSNLLELNNVSFTFKQIAKTKVKNQLDSIFHENQKIKLEQCKLLGLSNNNLKDENIIKYFSNVHNINKDNFSVLVLHENGCASCNEYYNELLKINNFILFSIDSVKQFYLLIVAKSENLKRIKSNYEYLFNSKFNKYVLIDTTQMYDYINKFNSYNPRLFLIKDNKLIYDSIAIPEKIDQLFFKLLYFYGLGVKKD